MKPARGVAAAMTALAAIVAEPAFGAEAPRAFQMRPMMATSIVAGGKHVLSYFRYGNGACRLTLMIESATPDMARASRIEVAVPAGLAAAFDPGDGETLRFGCTRAADAMIAQTLEGAGARE